MYYFVRYYRYIILLVSFLFILYGLLHILTKDAFFKAKYLVVQRHKEKKNRLLQFFILMIFLLNCVMIPQMERGYATAEISLNYPEASQGLNPNGTRYNQVDILNTEVLENTIEKGALKNVTPGNLKRTLSVWPRVQGSSENEDAYFISTQFVLSYSRDKDTMHLDGEKLTALAAEAYKEWFLRQYSDNVTALNLDFEEIEAEDYLDICEYLKKEAEKIGAYMKNMSDKESAFRSQANGETFQSVSSRAYKVSNVMVENLEAYVLENGLSKEIPTYMGKLGFKNAFLYFDALKADRASKNNLEAISLYEDDMARIVLVPTYDTDAQFYMSETRIGIDDFAADADSYSNQKTSLSGEIAFNNHVLNQLSQSSGSSKTNEKAEQLVIQIENELYRLAEEAKTLVAEYSTRQANEYMTITVDSWENRVGKTAVKVLLYTAVFAVGIYSAAIALSLHDREERKKHSL